jgi:methyl-accepting chemotaxis protein
MPFILIIIGIVLVIYNYRIIKRENKIKQEDKNLKSSFKDILEDNEDGLSDYKIEIGRLRKDIAESLTELQGEIIEIKSNFNKLKNSEITYEDIENSNEHIIDEKLSEDLNYAEDIISEISSSENIDSNKTHSIKKLLEDGLTVEQICYDLSVSKGEVLLVKGLFRK